MNLHMAPDVKYALTATTLIIGGLLSVGIYLGFMVSGLVGSRPSSNLQLSPIGKVYGPPTATIWSQIDDNLQASGVISLIGHPDRVSGDVWEYPTGSILFNGGSVYMKSDYHEAPKDATDQEDEPRD